LPATVLLLAGCSVPRDTSDTVEAHCIADFAVIDDAIRDAGTGDAQAVPIDGFPHLRATRFLAALAQRFHTTHRQGEPTAAFAEWLVWLAETASKGRAFELANLPPGPRRALRERLGYKPEAVVETCGEILIARDLRKSERGAILAEAIHVPDNYSNINKVLGLYPLTAFPVRLGFEVWKARNVPGFSDLPVGLNVAVYSPSSPTMPQNDVAELLARSAEKALGVPRPAPQDIQEIAAAFAPIFAVEQGGDHDRIGSPVLAGRGLAEIDTRTPRIYFQPSWALVAGRPLLQISYLAWLSERPPDGPIDPQAGEIDGLIWRVTLTPEGMPLIYDSIHACGCYHLFFPVPPLRARDRPASSVADLSAGNVVPIDAPVLEAGQRIVLHLRSGDHYLRALSVAEGNTGDIRYPLAAMDGLRSLPLPGGGRRSLYDPRGLVAGTERGERLLLWPMGIASAGAMRQWGTHATAFVGRRHFDDPYLIDRAFRLP
jgi:hypothetical protein